MKLVYDRKFWVMFFLVIIAIVALGISLGAYFTKCDGREHMTVGARDLGGSGVSACCPPLLSKRELVILVRGEMYRRGGMGSRDVTGDDLEQQNSIGALVEHIVRPCAAIYGGQLHVLADVVTTRPSADVDRCLSPLQPYLRATRLSPRTARTQISGLVEGLRWAQKMHPDAAILVMRPDAHFKKPLPSAGYSAQRITLPWQISRRFGHVLPSKRPRVNDVFVFAPSAGTLLAVVEPHQADTSLHNIADWMGTSDVNFFVTDESYDSDSAKEQNPYYRLIGRPEAPLG